MTQPSERQVLYALVGAGFLSIVGVLIVAAQAIGLVETWWTAVMGLSWAVSTTLVAAWWRRTSRVLGITIGLFVVWTVGTLIVT